MQSVFKERPTRPSESSKGWAIGSSRRHSTVNFALQAVEHPTQLFGLLGQNTSQTFLVLNWPYHSQ
jgi:hypothetical protein